ncbi:hypothetical protein T484DRAFT_2346773 [Baffinella frigidus]|nr:hypothetical protein T484DRAFT_2346773 [Cryptophyta sp. CCMP2293]
MRAPFQGASTPCEPPRLIALHFEGPGNPQNRSCRVLQRGLVLLTTQIGSVTFMPTFQIPAHIDRVEIFRGPANPTPLSSRAPRVSRAAHHPTGYVRTCSQGLLKRVQRRQTPRP